jgi:hypothetical protein
MRGPIRDEPIRSVGSSACQDVVRGRVLSDSRDRAVRANREVGSAGVVKDHGGRGTRLSQRIDGAEELKGTIRGRSYAPSELGVGAPHSD